MRVVPRQVEEEYWLMGVAETGVRQVGIITALVRLLDVEIRLVRECSLVSLALHPRSIRAPFLGPRRTMRDKQDEIRRDENPQYIREFGGYWWSVIACRDGAEERT